ncbi:MAG: hypothetical protein M3042_00315, partial [Actinomycetota bacterium]|nr:hypothetical protein [Actinomycetota bacterium]
MRIRTALASGLSGALLAALTLVSAPAQATTTTLLGGWSKSWSWYDANVGPVQIYRGYDTGWHFARWQDTDSYKAHPTAAANDYSFDLPPADVAAGTDDGILRTFIASTPKNIILTNYHEPEQEIEAGMFTAAIFRDSITHLAGLVKAQNLADGGTRRVSVVLMISTFTGFKARNPVTYWPTDATTGANTADLISADAYALPHNTGTPCCPIGYTDGISWKSATTLLSPALKFAQAHRTAWGISEFAYLEDINNPMHKAQAITDVVNYAKANGAVMCEYWDSVGGRADWQLRYNSAPLPSTSNTSNA